MLSFFNWFIIHNNWALALVWILMFSFMFCHDMPGRRIKYALIGLVIGLIPGGLSSWSGYNDYQNHYTTCSKPAAVKAFYVFDFEKERCFRPFVGLVPVNQKGNIEIPLPKPVEHNKPQLVSTLEGENNA
jgi:type IV secretory pathway VirB6-like protein